MILPSRLQAETGFMDVIEGGRSWRFWTMLGWSDIRQKYRRSSLGPFWITLSMGVMTGALAVIYSSIFKLNLTDYLTYLAAGITLWLLFSSTIQEGASAFIGAEGIIKQCTIPLSLHVYRVLWRNLIVFAHNVVVLVVYLFFVGSIPSINPITVLIGLILFVANLFVLSLLLATLCARFRDVQPILQNVLQLMFFVTPILFGPSQLAAPIRVVAHYNPLFHLIEVLRRPMIGEAAGLESYAVCVLMLLVSICVCGIFFLRFRTRIAYWL